MMEDLVVKTSATRLMDTMALGIMINIMDIMRKAMIICITYCI